jgi:pimeloyl-ACP methyl ester carboxylesterase
MTHLLSFLVWGRHDTNIGPAIAERLAHDIPGVVRIEWLTNSAHLPMLEEPEHYGGAIEDFLSNPSGTNAEVAGTAGQGQ